MVEENAVFVVTFYTEDGGSMLFQNVSMHLSCYSIVS
jgi:hypothetical protein